MANERKKLSKPQTAIRSTPFADYDGKVAEVVKRMSKLILESSPGDASSKSVLELDEPPVSSNPNQSSRFARVEETIELLFELQKYLTSSPVVLKSQHFPTVKKSIYFVISMGLIPCLFPSVWNLFNHKQKTVFQLNEDPKDISKYKELTIIIRSLFKLTHERQLRKLIFKKNPEVFLAGLCQLSLLPIKIDIRKCGLKYFVREQKMFQIVLRANIIIHKYSVLIREMILVIVTEKSQEKGLECGLRDLFSDLLMEDGGLQVFWSVACDLVAQTPQILGVKCCHVWSMLIHNVYNKSKTKYEELIVPLVWGFIRSKANIFKNSLNTIGVLCVHTMFSENYKDFLKYYLKPIGRSIKINTKISTEMSSALKDCIHDLHTLFYLYRDATWSLNPKLLISFAPFLYNFYTATYLVNYDFKSKLEDLVFLILTNISDSKEHLRYILFSPCRINVTYTADKRVIIKIIPSVYELHFKGQLNVVLDLIDDRFDSKSQKVMFDTLQDMYTDRLSMELIAMEKLFIVKAMNHLIKKDVLKNSVPQNLENVIHFINSILTKNYRMDFETLPIIKNALGYVIENIDETRIDMLSLYLHNFSKLSETINDEVLKPMLQDICLKIRDFRNSCTNKSIYGKRTIEDVLCDNVDPLLPCKAHALMELKKMIESGDETVLSKRSIILIVIKENLKSADLYIYQTAIFTLSSLGKYYPDDILQILCEAYTNRKMSYHSSETQLMIGDVLMKTVRSSNNTIYWHKHRLLDTFLADVWDDDHLLKAASLSYLSEVSELLSYDLGSKRPVIIKHAAQVIHPKTAVEPLRAAILLFAKTIEHCTPEELEICEDNIKECFPVLLHADDYIKDKSTLFLAMKAIENLFHSTDIYAHEGDSDSTII